MTIEQRPWYRSIGLYYWILRRYMYSKYKPLKPDKRDKEIFDQIKEDGFVVLEDFFPSDQADQMYEEVMAAYKKIKEEKHPDYFKHERGHERIGKINQHAPATDSYFYQNEQIWRIAKAYVSDNVLAYRKEADFKLDPGASYQANIAHFDDWRHRFKAFAFIHDVNDENAPMIYYRKSHEEGSWKRPYQVEFETKGENGRYGHFFPQEMEKLSKEEGLEPVKLTAKKGSLFLGDFRGIHQGTVLKSGKRVLLNCTFGL